MPQGWHLQGAGCCLHLGVPWCWTAAAWKGSACQAGTHGDEGKLWQCVHGCFARQERTAWQEGAAGVQGSDCMGSGCGCEGVCLGPRARWSPQFKLSMAYAGETWLEETEETSVLLWDTAEETSSSPKGFLPQQIVVIMQLRN